MVSLAFVQQAQALCSVGATVPASFGTAVSSISVRTTAQTSSTNSGGLNCTSALISLLASTDHFYATITGSSQGGMVGPSGDVISYTVYANNTTSFPMARGTVFDFGGPGGIAQTAGLISGPGTKTLPLYMSTTIGSNVAAGTYSETLSIFWNWNYCSGIGIGGICLGRDISSGTTTLTVSVTVANDCTITAPNIAFGSAPVISGFAPVTGQASIACTKGSAYTVGISDGQNPVSVGGQRRMISGSNFLNYDIFKSATTTRWGSVSTARRASSTAEVNPGNGLGTGSQVFNFNAAIYTNQATPPAGTYLDNVVLDVGF
ncbi:spore coat U domain-containing protein [Pseudomonas sp. Bout1]|uniref:Csu type fimbrial protein n=1 Tax=Pseudomonas sp. Bout1 TaxID=3048600 RepID=UPI002AB38AD3|nr:spore coat U domain-containing protein [Pseudomonas sp. Bout1]MDY7534344.1 spore coat U domain-containing protein [Pseudomonas sp. Bout1]MEB0188790.1 spore coat U domain-containing protein [Pseudomonas sp. Bout1]